MRFQPPDPNVTGAYDPPPTVEPLAPGTLLAGRYRLVAALGRGGMGEVYRADDLTLDQPVALKFLPRHLADDPDRLAHFRKEVAVARQISHPNVCRVYDIAEWRAGDVSPAVPFLTMEYVDGEDLASLLRRIGRVTADRATVIARELCHGLAAVHEQRLVHRDLKPANVMLDGRGKVRLTDFGLAAAAEDLRLADARSGTPAYMAPEQLDGEDVTPRSDLFALGLVLYELFTGRPAFSGIDRATPPRPPSSHVAGLDPAVERVILRCVARDPADRPASALAVVAALPGGDTLAALSAGETPSPQARAGTDRPDDASAALREALRTALAALLRAEQEEREAEAAVRAVRDQYEPALRRARQAQEDCWKDIARLMDRAGAAEVVVPGDHCDYKVAPSSAPEKVDVPDVSAVPEEFVKKEPRRKEILDYLKKLREAGAPLPGWATITRGAGSLCYKPVKKA